MISNSDHPPSTSESSQTAATSVPPPAKPPRKIVPFDIKCKPTSHKFTKTL